MDEKQRYIFIDTETTGLDPEVNDVIEIAMLVYDEDNEIARLSTKLSASGIIDLEALKVNKAQIADVQASDEGVYNVRQAIVQNVAQFLVDYMTPKTFVIGHNVQFDYAFLDSLFKEHGIDLSRLVSPRHLLDTQQIAKFLHDSGELDLKNFRMITLWNELFEGEGEYEDNAHSAIKDAIMVKDIYFKLRN
jgi:DNA polymerase III epsilon subunit-like protein